MSKSLIHTVVNYYFKCAENQIQDIFLKIHILIATKPLSCTRLARGHSTMMITLYPKKVKLSFFQQNLFLCFNTRERFFLSKMGSSPRLKKCCKFNYSSDCADKQKRDGFDSVQTCVK